MPGPGLPPGVAAVLSVAAVELVVVVVGLVVVVVVSVLLFLSEQEVVVAARLVKTRPRNSIFFMELVGMMEKQVLNRSTPRSCVRNYMLMPFMLSGAPWRREYSLCSK